MKIIKKEKKKQKILEQKETRVQINCIFKNKSEEDQ